MAYLEFGGKSSWAISDEEAEQRRPGHRFQRSVWEFELLGGNFGVLSTFSWLGFDIV